MHTPLGACSFWFAFAQKGTQLGCSRTAQRGQPKHGKWGEHWEMCGASVLLMWTEMIETTAISHGKLAT